MSIDIQSVKYLFKYVYKSHDRVVAVIVDPTNEIQQYINARYLSTAEGFDSLLLFKKHTEWLPVIRLVIHLLGQHNVIFNENEDFAVVAKRVARQITTLTACFAYNAQNANGRNMVYANFHVDHVWKIREKVWSARQRGEKAIGRMYFIHLAVGERFFLHLLLAIVLATTSFQLLRIEDDIEHPTFQVACGALGLLQDNVE